MNKLREAFGNVFAYGFAILVFAFVVKQAYDFLHVSGAVKY